MTRSERMVRVRLNDVCEKCMGQLRKEVRRYVTEELVEGFLKDLKYIISDPMGYYFGLQEDKYDEIRDKLKAKLKDISS